MTLYYLQTNIICLVILFVVWLSLRNKKGALPARRLAFNKLLLIIALICVTDVLAWYFSGRVFPGARGFIQVSNIVYDISITWLGYAWLNYVELRIKSLEYNHQKRRLLTALPLIVMIALLVMNPITSFLFRLDENNVYSRAGGIVVHWIISWGYLFCATLEVILAMRKTQSKVERGLLTPMLWFIVPPAIAAVLQMFFYGTTTTQCGATIASLIIALSFLTEEVSKDTLTGLNNRRALESYLIDRLQRSNVELTVIMCDVDKFKTINDTLGHTAGDLVLKRMAGAMKNVCKNGGRSLFLCRYGGDEFLICGTDLKFADVTDLTHEIENSVNSMNKDYADNLSFSISTGQASGVCSNYEDVEQLISMADAVMYQAKQAKKALRSN